MSWTFIHELHSFCHGWRAWMKSMSYIFSKYKGKLMAIVLLKKYYSCKKEKEYTNKWGLRCSFFTKLWMLYSDCESLFIFPCNIKPLGFHIHFEERPRPLILIYVYHNKPVKYHSPFSASSRAEFRCKAEFPMKIFIISQQR